MYVVTEVLNNRIVSVRLRGEKDAADDIATKLARENGAKGKVARVKKDLAEEGSWEDDNGYRVEVNEALDG